jgi:hypothetical protein
MKINDGELWVISALIYAIFMYGVWVLEKWKER